MTQTMRTMLSSTEQQLLSALREIPEGQLKARLETFLVELAEFVSHPACAEVQADGIPCGDVSADCEQCLMLEKMLGTLHATLPRH